MPRSLGPQFEFKAYGETRATLGSPLAPLGAVADDLCIIKSCTTDQFNHAPAQLFLNSGFSQPGRPCLGSWTLYGLGSETEDLPAFVVMSTGGGLSGGSALWSSGFLPTTYTGVQFRKGKDPILNISTPDGFSSDLQKDTFNLVNQLNSKRHALTNDDEIATRMASYEMAARLQSSAPELMDLKEESDETINLYGCNRDKHSFARACLLARRMVQRGVRFINIYHSGWDAHSNVKGSTENNCKQTARATAALIQDLKRHGLLDDTLVVWGGEFGRTPMVETNPLLDAKPVVITTLRPSLPLWQGAAPNPELTVRQMTSVFTSQKTKSMSMTSRPLSYTFSASITNALLSNMLVETSALLMYTVTS